MANLLIYLIVDNYLYKSDWIQSDIQTNDILIDPDYLQKGEFTICCTHATFGDWAILSAMPRILKQKFPNCKVYLPTKEWLITVLDAHITPLECNYIWEDKFSYVAKIFENLGNLRQLKE